MSATWTRRPIKAIKANPNNPRLIKDERFQKLVQSIKDFPEMLELRPIVVNAAGVVLGGNMRLKACQAAGLTEVPVIAAESLTEAQEREFVIKDNVGFGEWEWDALANAWDATELTAWGLLVPTEEEEREAYSAKIMAPSYEVTGERPLVETLVNDEKRNQLVDRITAATGLPAGVKTFLLNAAQRHLVFDYQNIAEFYAHADAPVQRLMEESALVIIDYDSAIRGGFVHLSEQIREAMIADSDDDAV